MAARMKIVVVAGRMLQARKIVPHHVLRKFPQARVRRTGVHRIRRMGHDGAFHAVFRRFVQKFRHIGLIQRFYASAPWVAREKCKCVRSQFARLPSHGGIALGGRNMAPDLQHSIVLSAVALRGPALCASVTRPCGASLHIL